MKDKVTGLFDISLAGIVLVVLGIIFYASFIYKTPIGSDRAKLVLKVPTENVEAAAMADKSVYLNGVNKAVSVLGVTKEGDSLLITLEAPGKVTDSKIIFNGQSVSINQKAEIHDSYFAQGRIISVTNE